MSDGMAALTYPVRPAVVGHFLGQLALMLALLSTAPLGVAAVSGDISMALRFAVIIAGLLGVGLLARRSSEPTRIQSNEALVVVSLAFVISPLLAAWPLAASGLAFTDALFEAVSAITTTGLSTTGSLEGRSTSFLFARAWMQWYGGLGIAVLSVALLLGPHAAARRLMASNTDQENLATTTRMQARQVLSVYIGLTLLGTVLLWLCIGDPASALLHMLSTLSTGGFAPADGSLAALPRSGAWVVSAFSLLGALPLLLYFYALRGRPGELLRDPEVKALVFVLLLGAALLAASLHTFSGYGWAESAQLGAMLGTSAQTTTGFAPVLVSGLDATSKLLLVGAMAIGGCSGSTAGGVKLLRVLVILRLLQYFIRRSGMPPHAAMQPRLAGRPLEAVDVERATLIITLFAAAAVVLWLIFVASGYQPLDALFEVTSALGTVGLSAGITRPELETPLKLLLCVAMLLGRLELLALLVLLYPRTWLSKRS